MARPSSIPIAPGLRFGRLTVIEQAEPDRWGRSKFKCKCDCGKITRPRAYDLRKNETQSCGCLQKERASKHNAKDITGQRFGRLVALYPTKKRREGCVVWHCQCDCGRKTESTTGELRSANTKSCGCLQREKASQINYRHGGATGYRASSLYTCWTNIKQRCLNPKRTDHKYYGGKGITLAPEWINDFTAFRDYVTQTLGLRPSSKHTIDRIENNEGYFPGNLKWSTQTEQNHNSKQSRINKRFNAILLECISKPARRRRRAAPEL